MRRRRADDFDVVIGIGGMGQQAIRHGIAGKVNWIGIGPETHSVPIMRYPVITFEHYLDLSAENCNFRLEAPILAKRMYSSSMHFVKQLSPAEIQEIEKLVERALTASQSSVNIRSLRARMRRQGKLWPGADFGPGCVKRRSVGS
jgi:hypothetical protein